MPGILLDCDGVLVDFKQSVLDYTKTEWGFKPEQFHIKEYDMRTWHDDLLAFRIETMLRDPFWYFQQNYYLGAIGAIRKLQSNGFRPVVVTSTIEKGHLSRRQFLSQALPDVEVLFSDARCDTKARLAVENKLQYFVEDSRSESSSLALVCKEGFLVNQDYNGSGYLPWNVWQVDSLAKAVELLT